MKRSLTQINKKWPKCCPSSAASSVQPPVCSHPSLVTIQENQSQSDIYDGVANLTTKMENLVKDLDGRIQQLEQGLSDFTSESKRQSVINSSALNDFNQMKCQFDKAGPILTQLGELDKPLKLDMMNKLYVKPSNGESKLNCCQYDSSPQNESSGVTTICASDEEKEEEETEHMNEITWLKDRMSDLSESMNLQYLATKSLKYDSLQSLKDEVEKLAEEVAEIKCKIIENNEKASLTKCQDITNLRRELDTAKKDNCKLASCLRDVEKKMEVAKLEVCDKIRSLKTELESQLHDNILSRPSTQNFSELMNVRNLQKIDEKKSRYSVPLECCESDDYHSASDHKRCPVTDCSNKVSKLQSELPPSNYRCCSTTLTTDCKSVSSEPKNPSTNRDTCSGSAKCGDKCSSSKSETVVGLENLQKQVSSHDVCLNQLIRDMAMKLDRSEFENCHRQLSEAVEMMMKTSKDQVCLSTAAGCTIPLMRDVNCISCQTTTNMTTVEEMVPKAAPLKYGRASSNTTNNSFRSQCQSMSDRNWMCYTRSSGRRVGGSHTKLSKAMEVREMRFRRLKTPVKIVSSITIYKNRFRRGGGCC